MPVYVHVINKGQTLADGNVPDSQIQQQITVLNQTFNGMRGGADTNFNFVLKGVDRTTNEAWFNMAPSTSEERAAKRALHQGGPDALNIYTAEGGGFLGWAYFPKDVAGSNGRQYIDGIVIAYGSMPGGDIPNYNLGFTATHEAGTGSGSTTRSRTAARPSATGSTTPRASASRPRAAPRARTRARSRGSTRSTTTWTTPTTPATRSSRRSRPADAAAMARLSRRLTPTVAAALLAPLGAPAAAEALIQVDRGIAGARLGNSRAEVRAALGAPASTRSGTNDFGPFLQWRFKGGISVLFQGRREVSTVSTTGRGDRTARGRRGRLDRGRGQGARARRALRDDRRLPLLPHRPLHRR